ncbi:OLC1v1034713C1 [Oldenlandia corymbosa var. corymbosa]|uniref:OLC1v1034713C1 n=1 Tax=Oldenlandia corymbosa var. corymbosa TaxID=529605 RepID=A0AAV1CU77_OLDCO|nr:OLC1v1034713C1 [Oldenlandia corymbosa var. corymbosa]
MFHILEFIAAGTVTLASIEIFKTHEMLNLKPTVYFKCKGENMTTLPDVTEKHVVYNFKGEESWQPLTELLEKKCKRCGIYEHDKIASDDVFDEWELCASDFTDGKYNHVKEGEFNATFLCSDCVPSENASEHPPGSHNHEKGMHWTLVGLISAAALVVIIVGIVTALKYWQKRKKQQEQARFLKLFEDGDEIEDELGIGPLSHVI